MAMTAEKIARAKEMLKSGMTYKQIGAAIGVSGSAVGYQLNPARKAKQKEYRMAHKDDSAAYRASHKDESSAYRAARREETAVYNEAYRASHKDEAVAYRIDTKEYRAAYNRGYNEAHKEELIAYRYARKEQKAAYDAIYGPAYIAKHLPESAARCSIRRALIAGTMIGITIAQKAQIDEIYRKAKEDPKVRCYICDKLIPLGDREVDHILPVSKGGPTRPSNLAIACSHCNRSKNAKHPNELGILI